jgi:alkylhydroperoxidase/carboxymuconolactone decarboxylase family protein YurZ
MGAVTAAVIGEYSADRIKKYSPWKGRTEKWSARFLILALAVELFATVKTNTINNLAIADLSNKAQQAAALAGRLGAKVDDLNDFVEKKEKMADDRMDSFKKFASDQKVQSDAIVAALTAKQKEVTAVIEAAKKDEAELEASANTIGELRQKLHDLTTKRVLTEQQIADLTKRTRRFAKVTFDLASTRDSDSPNLARQIGIALRSAGWEWTPRSDLGSLVYEGFPMLGSSVSVGLQVNLCKSDESSLAPAINALYLALAADGYELKHGIFADGDAAARNEPCGKIHIIVGSKL